MQADTQSTAAFYASIQGALAARLLRERMALMWPPRRGASVLGIGYPAPYLVSYLADAPLRVVALTQAQCGVTRWPLGPPGQPGLSCTAEEDALPFPDLSFDRVLLVHGLEAAENAGRLLREAWRVLKDDGRLLVVASNRRGWWAYADATPFGQGQPYSPGQITRLLEASMFRVERRDAALFVPPVWPQLVQHGASAWERVGRLLVPQFAGVTLTEASKDAYAAVPTGATVRRRMVLAEAAWPRHHRKNQIT